MSRLAAAALTAALASSASHHVRAVAWADRNRPTGTWRLIAPVLALAVVGIVSVRFQLEAKFAELPDGSLPPDRTKRLIETCWTAWHLTDAGDILRLGSTAG